MLANLIGSLFVLLLVAGVPALSHLSVRRVHIRLIPRPDLYLSAIISQWVLAALGALVVFTVGPGFRAMGLRAIPGAALARWTLLLTVVSLAALGVVLLLERHGWWPAEESELVRLLLPETRREKLLAVLMLAPTAALCEEFLYRGYLLAQFSRWIGPVPWAWIGSSVAFGLAHAYQGLNGMVRAALLGGLLAYPVIYLGSLYPAMVAHFVIDAVALAWLGPKFLKREADHPG
jgi:membrane protease YdiL (CAAX protease family)